MPQVQGSNSAQGGRIDGSLQKTTLTAADFALGVGWGDGAVTKTLLVGSTDQRGQLTITSVGSNQAQATATVVLTFADGAFASAPFGFALTTNDNSIDTGRFVVTTTATAATFTFSVLPVATKIYILKYFMIA